MAKDKCTFEDENSNELAIYNETTKEKAARLIQSDYITEEVIVGKIRKCDLENNKFSIKTNEGEQISGILNDDQAGDIIDGLEKSLIPLQIEVELHCRIIKIYLGITKGIESVSRINIKTKPFSYDKSTSLLDIVEKYKSKVDKASWEKIDGNIQAAIKDSNS